MNFHSHRVQQLVLSALISILISGCVHKQTHNIENSQSGSISREEIKPTAINPEKLAANSVGRQPASIKTTQFDWPVDEARLTRGFLPHKRKPHLGLDLAAPRGTPILAAHEGTVIYTGHDFHGYGKMILIESPAGYASLYAHLDKILVKEGQKVQLGENIGAMGRTGRATGVHLHFEIRKNLGPIDPLAILPDGARFEKYTAN